MIIIRILTGSLICVVITGEANSLSFLIEILNFVCMKNCFQTLGTDRARLKENVESLETLYIRATSFGFYTVLNLIGSIVAFANVEVVTLLRHFDVL